MSVVTPLRPLYALIAWSGTPVLFYLLMIKKGAKFHWILVATDDCWRLQTSQALSLSLKMQAYAGRRVREVLCYKRADRK